MFGGSSFSELSFAEIPKLKEGIQGSSEVAIHFNKSFLTFAMQLNRQADFDLNINKSFLAFVMQLNQQADFDLAINSQQDHSLEINKQIEFSVER